MAAIDDHFDFEVTLEHEIEFPTRAALPYRVVYNGNSLSSICSDTDKVQIAAPPPIPEGRHTYFQAHEPQSRSMQYLVYTANRYPGMKHSRDTWRALAKEWEELALSRLRQLDELRTLLMEAIPDSEHFVATYCSGMRGDNSTRQHHMDRLQRIREAAYGIGPQDIEETMPPRQGKS